jgi:ribosomal protein S18 acetylase RimI-like enzyme
MRNITIRKASLRDAAAIAELTGELAAAVGEESPVTAGYARTFLRFPGNGALLARAARQVVGLVTYSVRPDLYHAAATCLIAELIVREAARGQGVGSALMKDLFSRLAKLGCAEVSVSTMPDNRKAIEFYKAHGMTDEAVLLEKHFC